MPCPPHPMYATPSHPIPSDPHNHIPFHPTLSLPILSHPIPFHSILSHPTPSYLRLSYPIHWLSTLFDVISLNRLDTDPWSGRHDARAPNGTPGNWQIHGRCIFFSQWHRHSWKKKTQVLITQLFMITWGANNFMCFSNKVPPFFIFIFTGKWIFPPG